VVPHVENVIADNEFEGVGSFRGAYETIGIELVFWDICNHTGEQAVVGIPCGNDDFPGHLAIAVNADPVVFCVTGTAVGSIERGAYKAHVVVGGGIDQVAEFFFRGPGGGSGRLDLSGWFGESAQVGEFAIYCFLQKGAELFGHGFIKFRLPASHRFFKEPGEFLRAGGARRELGHTMLGQCAFDEGRYIRRSVAEIV
jgi:hypothetical protein